MAALKKFPPSCPYSWNDDEAENDAAAEPAAETRGAETALDAEFERFQKQKTQDLERERMIKEHEAQRAREEEEEKARQQAEQRAAQEQAEQ